MLKDIRVSCAPHVSGPLSTRKVMLDVVIGLTPAMLFAFYYYRVHSVVVILSCVLSCVAAEWICNKLRGVENPMESIGDLSAVVTGIILGLSLPPSFPFWASIIGGAFSISIGKMVFGGLGSNVFNPAMVGRAFLTASFGMLMTTWTVPYTIDSSMPAISVNNKVEVRTQATPLAVSKQSIKSKSGAEQASELTDEAFVGEIGGCLGETSGLALLIGGIYLFIRRAINFHIPLAVLSSAFVFGGIFYMIDSSAYVSPVLHMFSGGMLLCAFFIATDPVTAPLTKRGMWIFGIGVGTLTMLIRIVGEYPGGVMYSVLLMNAVTPLIDRFCKKIPAGGEPRNG